MNSKLPWLVASIVILSISVVSPVPIAAQSMTAQTTAAQTNEASAPALDLEQAVRYALDHYPAVRASLEQLAATRAGVALARTNYLPRADMLWQGNRATRNNIFGLLLPNSVISPISGPVLPSTSTESAWGSAAGLLFSWEPADFGRRGATVGAARARENVANSGISVTRLDVAAAVANAFLTVAAAQQRVAAASANVERRQVFANSVHVLVNNDLRPGADASRADAELALARTELFQAEQAEAVNQAALADLLVIPRRDVQLNLQSVLAPPPATEPSAQALNLHPVAREQQAQVDVVRAREHILDRSYFPRLYFQSTVYGRGSGANTNGTFDTGTAGLGIDRWNWAAGVMVTFPAFDIFSIRAQKQQEAANERVERARYDQTIDDLNERLEQARATLNGARQIAENTPIELRAARDAETQTRARYQAGLANIVEVAEAQGLLVQAETDDALARLAVWSGLASIAVAQGDLQPFLQMLSNAAPKQP